MSQNIYDQVAMQLYGRLYENLFPAQQAKVLLVVGEQLLGKG